MKIDISYGNGGAETNRLIKDIFAKHLGNPILNRMEDAATINVTGKIAYTTDSFVVKPLFFPGGDIGRLAVCGTVNDLACVGAQPKYITVAFIIEEGLDTDDLESIVRSMKAAAKESGIKVVAGDTKVIEGAGGLYINTSGIGLMSGKRINASGTKNGDAIIVTGTMGDHHACILSSRMGIENSIKSDAAPLYSIVQALRQSKVSIHSMRDVTRGGLATVLNELAEASGLHIQIEESALPISREVGGLCGILGLDPLYMGNEGKLVLAVSSNFEHAALDAIKKTKYGKNAAVIGHACRGEGVVLRTIMGGKRLINTLTGEGLPRIC